MIFLDLFDEFKKESDYKPIVAIIKTLVLAELVAPRQGTNWCWKHSFKL